MYYSCILSDQEKQVIKDKVFPKKKILFKFLFESGDNLFKRLGVSEISRILSIIKILRGSLQIRTRGSKEELITQLVSVGFEVSPYYLAPDLGIPVELGTTI
ncbi:hypothetical protein ACTA71_008511 [Dictyostelium dimigraforme]